MPKPRIESLSDLIFGLALSIGSLSLLSRPAVNPSDVVADIFGFGFSFFILISVWLRYTAMVSAWPRERFETGRIMWLNILLLFFVSIEPYLLSLISFGPSAVNHAMLAFTSQIYALDLTGLNVILGLFAQVLTNKEEAIKPELIGGYTWLRNTQFVCAGLFALSALPVFWYWMIEGTPLRFYLWYAILASIWVSRGLQHLLFLSRKAKNM
ncbi:MAG TPA: TMEM175 family protein [Candidatus Acidoferrum sp.]|nr:TMEM175 family protein [Candidatus Acidoferrum sp.]